MAKKTIVWFRNDLRVHDNPALHDAVSTGEVLPVFVLDSTLLTSSRASSNRNRFLIESLQDLKKSLQDLGSNLVLLENLDQLVVLANEQSVSSVHYTIDYTPYARSRDQKMKKLFEDVGVDFVGSAGHLIVDSLRGIETKNGKVMKVFTPFYKQWVQIDRRSVHQKPASLPTIPSSINVGTIPSIEKLTQKSHLSEYALSGGESAARTRLTEFFKHDLERYGHGQNDLGDDSTSRLSSYLHFGCISSREIESKLGNDGPSVAFRRQLCWRDFYHYILLHYPDNTKQEFQPRYHGAKWSINKKHLEAWENAQTGYPIVDAAMTQLLREGWMHNRARLIVGSFLTKDLGIDWREGEAHFLKWLIDGDMANNNGNWQWIASVGVDPAPVFRRLYNPTLQQQKFDPNGEYIRRYLPQFKNVPTKHLGEPWNMSDEEQREFSCIVGKDYPEPIVDHKEARKAALEWYGSIAANAKD